MLGAGTRLDKRPANVYVAPECMQRNRLLPPSPLSMESLRQSRPARTPFRKAVVKLEIDFVSILLSCYGECPRQVRLQSSVANQFVRPLIPIGRSELILQHL